MHECTYPHCMQLYGGCGCDRRKLDAREQRRQDKALRRAFDGLSEALANSEFGIAMQGGSLLLDHGDWTFRIKPVRCNAVASS